MGNPRIIKVETCHRLDPREASGGKTEFKRTDWFRIRAGNGKTLLTSETYSSPGKARRAANRMIQLVRGSKWILASLMVAMLTIPSASAACLKPTFCGNTTSCLSELKKFTSYAAFETWLKATPYAEFDVLYATSTTYVIQVWGACRVIEFCLDANGPCTEAVTP